MSISNKPLPTANIKKKILARNTIHPNISDCIIKMETTDYFPYYSMFSRYINFHCAKIGTCGVNATDSLNFYWDEEFIENISMKELVFVIIHEIYHLIFDHPKRGVGYDNRIANLAMDAIINSLIHSDIIINEGLSDFVNIPKDSVGNNTAFFMPKEYTGPHIFECVYEWMLNDFNNWKNENSDKIEKHRKKISMSSLGNGGNGDGNDKNESNQGSQDNNGNQQGQDGNDNNDVGNMEDYDYGENGVSGDENKNKVDMYAKERFYESAEFNQGNSLDVHFDDDVSDSVKREIVNNIMEELKQRGFLKGNLEKTLEKLIKKRKDPLKYIKRTLSNIVFGNKKMKNITRPNRRDIWGLKGNKKYKIKINVILDTSGSMSGEFEKVLSYVFQNDIEFNLIQIDTEVQDIVTIKNMSQLKKSKIVGMGGTTLSPALDVISKNPELNKLNNVVLTDGYTDVLDFQGVNGKTLIITTDTKCDYKNNKNTVKHIMIEKENKK